jgi:murein DD-endopeptidase MepM/ murein hydrolase activator NlpD
VTVAGWPDNSGYGNRVMIDHGNGYVTLYGHMSRIDVTVGQTVNRGDRIGLEGSTGRSTGPHLHFEVRKGGATVNPLLYLK